MSLGKAAVYKHIPVYYPGSRRLGRRHRRPGRRPRRLHPADHVRRDARPDGRVDQLLHAAVRDRRRFVDLDALRDPAHGARGESAGTREVMPQLAGDGADPQAEHKRVRWPVSSRTGGRTTRSSGRRRAGPLHGAICGSRSRACCWPSRSGSCGPSSSPSCRRSASSTRPISCSGWRPCRVCRARRCGSSTPSWCRSSAAGCGRRCRRHRC